MATKVVEIRCPHNPRRLLLKVGRPVFVDGANMIEVACRACRDDMRHEGKTVMLVVHYYNVLGQIVDTQVS